MPDQNQTVAHRPLTAADILAPLLPEPFPLPELGGVIYLYPLSAADAFDFAKLRDESWETAILATIIKLAVDSEGQPIFAGITPDQLVRRLPVHVFNRLTKEVTRRMDEGFGRADSADSTGEPVTNPFVQTEGGSSGEPSSESGSEPAQPGESPNPTTQTPPALAY